MKVLVITVGTGLGKGGEKSLAEGILFSIETQNPEKIVFVASKESRKITLPLILEKIKDKYEVEVEEIDDISDVEEIYRNIVRILKKLSIHEIVIDFTSGTKAMSVGTALAGFDAGAEMLSYIAVRRNEKNEVIKGSERPIIVRPYRIIAEKKLKIIEKLFDSYQFNSCLRIIEEIRRKTRDPEIMEKVEKIENSCRAYREWDLFNHKKSFELRSGLANNNKQFLGKLLNSKTPEKYYIPDLINNAMRRYEEGRYDDATARLYRTLELIAQYRLKEKYGIDSSNVDIGKLPLYLEDKYEEMRDEKGRIKLPLSRDYELLHDLEDELGKKYMENEKLKDLLNIRNSSILAHGLTPVSREKCEELYSMVKEFAEFVIEDLESMLSNSKFPKFEKLGYA